MRECGQENGPAFISGKGRYGGIGIRKPYFANILHYGFLQILPCILISARCLLKEILFIEECVKMQPLL
jgi:hypothetical protein